MLNQILQIIIAMLFKVGLVKMPVEVLHRDYIRGEIPADGLFQLLHPSKLPDFIEHHKKTKDAFNRSEELGFTNLEQTSPALQTFLESNPLMKAVLLQDGVMLMDKQTRRRYYFALMQLERIIEDGILEQRILGKRKQNVIRRIN